MGDLHAMYRAECANCKALAARVAELEADRDRWKAVAEKRHEIIESLEWCMDSMDEDGTFRRCPTCSAFEPETHESDCAVAEAIAASARAANGENANE